MGPRKLAALAALAALAVSVASPARAEVSGRGTAASSLTAASVTVGSLVDADLVTIDALSTLDKQRQGTTENLARNRLSAASLDLAGVKATVPRTPIEVRRSESARGDESGPVAAIDVTVPGALPAADIGATNAEVARLVTDIQGTASATAPNGSVVSGTVRPLNLKASYGTDLAAAVGGSSADLVSVLGGMVQVRGLSVAEQGADAARALSRGATRELAVDSVTVLDMGSLLHLLGIEPASVPVATLAAMADELGVPLSGTLGATPLASYGSWTAARSTLATTAAELAGALGGACGTLPGATSGLLGQVGVGCTGTVQQALDAVNALLAELEGILEAAVDGAALVSLSGVTANVQAVASVSEDGVALTTAQASGAIGSVRIGGVDVGEVVANVGVAPLGTAQRAWDALENRAHSEIDQVLGQMGGAFAGLVQVQVVPTLVQRTAIDGNYAVAEASMALLRAQVTVPGGLPDPQDLATLPAAGGTTPTTTPTTPTTPTVPTTVTTAPVPTTVTVPTLPISHVRPAPGLAPTATVEVGVISARADFTAPGIEITGGGENRTWNSRTGFGNPGDLPRTGASTAGTLVIFAVLSGVAYGLHRLARGQVRRIVG